MLIRAYGQYWNPTVVDWGARGPGNKGTLEGKVKINGTAYTVDFWDAIGIYVLHNEFKPVYVGKAIGTRIGKRLRDHLTDRHAGRWDMFSWFSQSTINTTTCTLRDPGTRQFASKTITDTLEALAILITDPPMNRKRESIPNAIEAIQKAQPQPKAIREYLQEILDKP